MCQSAVNDDCASDDADEKTRLRPSVSDVIEAPPTSGQERGLIDNIAQSTLYMCIL